MDLILFDAKGSLMLIHSVVITVKEVAIYFSFWCVLFVYVCIFRAAVNRWRWNMQLGAVSSVTLCFIFSSKTPPALKRLKSNFYFSINIRVDDCEVNEIEVTPLGFVPPYRILHSSETVMYN
jgi:hypothetical protein